MILPNVEPYLQLLEPEMQLEKQRNEMKRHEAWRVYGALLVCFFRFCTVLKAFIIKKVGKPPIHMGLTFMS